MSGVLDLGKLIMNTKRVSVVWTCGNPHAVGTAGFEPTTP